MNAVLTPVDAIPPLRQREAAALAAQENIRFTSLIQSLDSQDWTRPTDCPAWDVRALISHVLGAMEGQVSLREFVHQQRAGNKAAGDRPAVDGMTEVQVRDRAHLTPAQLVAAITATAPRAARRRGHLPAPLRRLRFKVDVGGVLEPWTLGYLFETILTRDTWMHRIDIARATDRPLTLTAEHDGRIVADVVAEWARRHGRPFTLRLSGPAGGAFAAGAGGDEIALDAVEFCRTLSGRAPATGLLTQVVPF